VNYLSGIFTIVCFLYISLPVYAENMYFTGFKTYMTFNQYIGTVTFENTSLENGHDELGVYVSDGNNGSILIGACVIGENHPGYYMVHIYADDSQTQAKDGAVLNDILTFKIWDKSENKLYVLSNTNSMSRENTPGLNYPEMPPIYPSGGMAQYGFLHLTARNVDLDASIALFKGVPGPKNIRLTWITTCEKNLSGFRIFRKNVSDTEYSEITREKIPATGSAFTGADYCFIDENVIKDTFYRYQLISVDLNGQQTVVQTTLDISVSQSFLFQVDYNRDNQFGLADIIVLMKRICQ